MTKLFGYGRVSTLAQDTGNQRLELERAGYDIPDKRWFVDEGISGKTPAMARPAFTRLLAKIDEGDTLIVAKLDRLGRDAVDVLQTIEHLKNENVRVKVLNLGDNDVTSPHGKLMLTMLAAVAAMERDLLIERTQSGLAKAKADGKVLGRRQSLSPAQQAEARKRVDGGEPVAAVARSLAVARGTVYKAIAAAPM
jgi:DNA invertase Pin-like site-specific DNA recombinase